MKITLEEIKKLKPCEKGLKRLLYWLGNRKETTVEEIALNQPIFMDVLWLLGKIKYTGLGESKSVETSHSWKLSPGSLNTCECSFSGS